MKKLAKIFVVVIVLTTAITCLVACGGGGTPCEHTYSDDYTCHDRVCTKCGETVKATTEHNFSNGWCECNEYDPEVYVNGFKFSLINDDSEYEIVDYVGKESSVVIPSTHEGKSVTGIARYAFYYNNDVAPPLTSITIPSGVTSIGENAFRSVSLTIYCEVESKPDGWDSSWNNGCPVVWDCNNNEVADDGCVYTIIDGIRYALKDEIASVAGQPRNITTANIPASVTYKGNTYDVTNIVDNAFFCSSLTSITIPDSVTSIGASAFCECTALTSISIPDSVISIGSRAFVNAYNSSYCYSLPIHCEAESQPSGWDSEWNLLNYPVVWNSKSNDVADDGYVYTIIDGIRYSLKDGVATVVCQPTNITVANIMSSVTYKGNTYTVTSIKDYAFYGCRTMTSITIPDSVTSMGKHAFYNCRSLNKVNYLGTIDQWAEIDFGAYYDHYTTNPLVYAKNLYIDDILVTNAVLTTATKISDCAFSNCTSLTSITIPNSVKSIGEYAFEGCEALTSITISDNVTTIGRYAFDDTGYYNDESNWEDGDLYLGKYLLKRRNTNLLSSYEIKEGTKVIAEGAFRNLNTFWNVTIPDSVESIGEEAFFNCRSLKSVTFGANSKLVSIGNGAFGACTSLTSITIPDSVTSIGNNAFSICTSLTSITIPDSVTNIGSYALSGCTLTSISIPKSVTSIGEGAFSSCTSLNSIDVEENNANYKSIDGNLYSKDGKKLIQYAIGKSATSYIIPDGVTSIGPNAFAYCDSLTSITIPDSVKEIGSEAFKDCDSLIIYCEAESQPSGWDSGWNSYGHPVVWNCNENDVADDGYIYTTVDSIHYLLKDGVATVTRQSCQITTANIPASVTYEGITYIVTIIEDYAFENCVLLTSITIPDSVTSIGADAFSNCTSLISIIIPNSIINIDSYTFYNCTSLESLTFSENSKLENIGYFAFGNCTSLTSVTIPDSVTSIDQYAFDDCISLTSITIPNSVTSIGRMAFTDCPIEKATIPAFVLSYIDETNLKEIVITSGESIGDRTFEDCTALTTIAISDSVTSIGEHAFYNCTSLVSITIPDSVTSIGMDAFYNTAYYNDESNWKDGVLYIGSHLIEAKPSISGVYTVKMGTKTIAQSAFSNCASLTSITIPDSVMSIGEYAFYGCTSLESMTLPFVGATKDGTENTHFGYIFGASSDYDNDYYVPTSLKSVTITGGESIGEYAFYGCTSLTSITIPDSVTSIGQYAFAGSELTIYCEIESQPEGWDDDWYFACQVVWGYDYIYIDGIMYGIKDGVATVVRQPINTTTANISASVTYMENTYSVTSIKEYAFYNCRTMTSITIPDSVTSIGEYAFCGCTSLTSITIPDSVMSIGEYAFYGCNALTIYCEAESWQGGWSSDWNYSDRPVYWYSETEPTVEGDYWHYDSDGNVSEW